MAKKAVVILAPGFEEVEAVVPIDFLRRAGVECIIAGVSTIMVASSHNVTIQADTLIDSCSFEIDAVILPGGMPGTTNLAQSVPVLTMIQKVFAQGGICGAICAAPLVFDNAGILRNKRYTCHFSQHGKLHSGTLVHEPVVVDGTVITSQGAGTAILFALTLVERLVSKEVANDLAKKIMY